MPYGSTYGTPHGAQSGTSVATKLATGEKSLTAQEFRAVQWEASNIPSRRRNARRTVLIKARTPLMLHAMQIEIIYLGNDQVTPPDPKWVLLVLNGEDSGGVIYHEAGATVVSSDASLTAEAVGAAEIEARALGLSKIYVEGA